MCLSFIIVCNEMNSNLINNYCCYYLSLLISVWLLNNMSGFLITVIYNNISKDSVKISAPIKKLNK